MDSFKCILVGTCIRKYTHAEIENIWIHLVQSWLLFFSEYN